MKKMSCLFYCCTKRTYFYAFLFLYRYFGNSSDHGMIFSSKSAVSLFPVILVSMYSIYSYGFRPFIFALSIMLYAAPLALAPLMLFENRKFLEVFKQSLIVINRNDLTHLFKALSQIIDQAQLD